MRIEEAISVSGVFWRPDNPEKRLYGTLGIIDGGEIALTVLGNFDASMEFINELEVERIVGLLEKGKYVTLDRCLYRNKTMNFGGGLSKSVLMAHHVYYGVAFDAGEEPKWHSASFSFDGLDEWHSVTGIKVSPDFNERTCDISYRPVSDILLWSDTAVRIELTFAWSIPGFPHNTEAKVTQRSYLKVTFVSEQPMEEFWRYIRKLNTFFCFAIDRIVSVQEVSVSNNNVVDGVPSGKQYPVQIKHYYQSSLHNQTPPKTSLPFMLIPYHRIQGKTQNVIGRWFGAHEIITPSLNLYFAAQTRAFQFMDGRFLALAQCLETYHRRTSAAKQMPDEQFDQLRAALIAAAPPEMKELVQNKIQHWNEPTLTTRLHLMLSHFRDLFGSKKKCDSLAWKISQTRNYLTHYSKDLEGQVMRNGGDLWVLCQKMEALFQLYLLQELGFTDEEIKNIATSSQGLIPKLNDNLEPMIKFTKAPKAKTPEM